MLTGPGRPRFLPAVERALGRTVTVLRELPGGTHARTWLIELASPEHTLILREFPPGDDAAAAETRILGALDGLDGLAPRLVVSDSSNVSAAGSWTLISRLPGIADLRPAPPARLAEQLGQALARIHATAVDGLAGFGSVFAAGAAPARRAAVQPLSWSPPTGNLLYDERVADRFLASYEEASGSALADPLLWDLWAVARSHENVLTWVPNYRDLGRGDLTARELRRRHDAWTSHVLRLRRDHARLRDAL